MAAKKVGIGIVGCGTISGIYLKVAPTFDLLEVVACADIVVERARARAAEFGVAKALSVEELLADPEVELVVNLTIPAAHGQVALAAVEAGKSVYNEKPLAVDRAEAAAGARRREGRPGRRCARHLPRRRHPDLPQADRRRRDRRPGRGGGHLRQPRPRGLAPRPGLLL